jgi:ankyrin repeat protein
MGNNLISPRNAKVFSYNSPERTKVPSLTPDLTTVKLLIERQDWRGLQQILLDNKEWLLSPTSSGNGCLIAGKHPLHHALCVQAPKFFIETILKIDYSSVDKLSEDQRDEKGFQAIHFAVKFKNSVDVLETIMKYDERAYEKLDHAGRLPLHVALLAGNQMDIIEYLVGLHPLSIKTRTKSGGFPLHLALEGKCIIDVIKFLIARNPDTTRQSYNANLPLHVACASKCTLEVFDLLYSCNENAVHCFGEESKPVLHFAVASKCCIEIIKKLIDLNEEFLLHRDKTARMPIHYAIENRVNDETLMLLIERSPQSLSCRGRGTPGNYPLAMAIEKNISTAIILEMIHIYPAAVKQKTVYGMFPLRSAIREKISGDVLLALLDVYPDAASEVDEHGRVALHYASSRDTPIVLIDALISSYPLGISKADRNNQIPLHLACIRLCSLSLIRLLLDRFRQGARYLDIYQNTPLNYVIENNGGLEYYKTLIDSDKKCMELFPPDSLSKLQGKLPLHQAIEFQREYSVIELLARSYPDGCSIAQVSTGRLALHLAIMRPLSIDSLLVIEETYPAAAQVADNDGLFPVHYAIKMKTDSQLISRLLKNNRKLTRLNHFPLHMKRSQACQEPLHAQPFDDDDRQDCCQGHRLLLHYAIDESTSPENVAEILKYTMPYDCDKGQYFHEHFYTWTHILAHTNDLYWKSIEIVLQPYSSSIISLLSEFLDEHQRKAIDIATPRCHRVILYRLHYYARYELPSTKNIHLTNITMLKRGIDHFQGKKLPVILKFYSCFQSFINELKLRESVALDDRYVVPLIQAHNGDEDYNYREESIQKRFEQYRYLMVVNAGYRSLDDIIRHDFISPTNCSGETITVSETRDMTQGDATAVKNYGRQILAALQHLHDLGVCHGNLHRKYKFLLLFV